MNRYLGVRFGFAVFFLVWMPLIAACSATYWLWLRTESRPGTALQSLALRSDALRLAEAAEGLSEALDTFLLERLKEVKSWTESAEVSGAAQKVQAAHEKEGFHKLTIAEVERKFRTRKSLGLASEARTYLSEQVRLSPYFAEVFFTDNMGFNVAVTSPTTDFVQSDENWWQAAWATGSFVSDVEFDASSNLWAVEISVLIRDKSTGKPLGVMKAVLGLRFAQLYSDRLARRLSQPGQLLHSKYTPSASRNDSQAMKVHFLVVNRDGMLIAETRSSHARGRIMQPEFNVLTTPSLAHMNTSYDGDRSGSFIATRQSDADSSQGANNRSYLVAFARSAGASFYAPVVENFSGFDWMIIAETPNLSGYDDLSKHAAWPTEDSVGLGPGLAWLGAALFGVLLLSSILLCWTFGRWVLKPVRALTNQVQRMEQGRIGTGIAIAATGELADLASALERIRNMIARMANQLRQTAEARPRQHAPEAAPPERQDPGTS